MRRTANELEFFAGGGEMGDLMRTKDWAHTALGAPAQWAPSLKAMVRMALGTRHPVFIFWGPRHTCLYNDAYRQSLGTEKHPSILGQDGRTAWPEIWDVIGPQIDLVMRGEGSTWHQNQLVPILRNGAVEDAYWTYSFCPIDDERATGGIGGVLVLCTETTAQVLAERRLATDRERFALFFEQAPSFMALLRGPRHTFELANPAYLRLVGRDVLGRQVADAFPEVEGQGFIDILDGVYGTGQPYVGTSVPIDLMQADGTSARAWLDFVYQPIKDEAGKVTGIFVEGVDVTERRTVERELALKAEQLQLATEAAEIGLWDVDLVLDKLYWPPRLKVMFGIAHEQPVSLADFYAGLHPDDREATTAAFAAALDPHRRAVYDVEFRVVGRADGVVRWLAAKGRGIFDEDGRCIRAIGTAIDITRSKQTEAELRGFNATLEQRVAESLAERNVFATLVENASAIVQVLDHSYRWLALNEACAREFEAVYGHFPQVGECMLDVLAPHPEHLAQVRSFWDRALAGDAFTETAQFGLHERTRRYYEVHFNPLQDASGTQVGAYQFVYDVTERIQDQERLRQAEAALLQSRKMEAIGQLTGGVAHDFNNILQAVRGNLELVRRKHTLPDKVLEFSARAVDATRRGSNLTAQLLTFSREQSPELKPLSIAKLFRGLEGLLRTSLGPTHQLALELPDDGLFVIADKTQLEMALLNTAVNARDAMPEGGVFQLSARARVVRDDVELAPGDYVDLVARDTGHGMTAEVLARAFDPFFTTKAVGKGSGLGLSQIYGMARRAGGSARLESRPANGTAVILTLRGTSDAEIETESEILAVSALPSRHAATVLLVDDDDDVRQVLADALVALGHTVIAANGGQMALEVIGKRHVDAAVVDFAMAGMNGAELAIELRKSDARLPIVLVSGYSDSAAITAALGDDIVLLRKPFDISALQATFDAAMRGARAA